MPFNALHLSRNTWLIQLVVLVLLILRIGAVNWLPEAALHFSMLLYAPVLILKSLHRMRKVVSPTTKGMAILLMLIGVILLSHSVAGLAGKTLLPVNGYHVLAGFTLLISISEYTFLRFNHVIHPALAFVGTFLGIIFLGTVLLMLPEATKGGISFVDALFTSTSAVCVTGLAVLDTGRDFTLIGQGIILFLIQLGGLGILTFTNLFGLLFRGEKSFRDLIFLTDLISASNLRNTFRHLAKIVGFVFIIELIGFLLIFFAAPDGGWFFALFHSISAFCNAGFSTLSSSLYDPAYRYNYLLQIIIAVLFIIGGIGYNVFFNVFSVIRFRLHRVLYRFTDLIGTPPKALVKWDINTTLVMRTTTILILAGWILFFLFERNNTLAEHNLPGKIATAFFGSVTPRTAGFNTVDIGTMLNPTIMLYLLLMWIGGSPGSTAGGIKTTAFAIATLNLLNQIRNRDQLIFKWQRVAPVILSRVASIISLSLIALGFSTALVISIQPELPVLKVAFECFSAYGTVGLSMNLTPQLNPANRIVIAVMMFLGRVSFFTFLIAIFSTFRRASTTGRLIYPENNIFVN